MGAMGAMGAPAVVTPGAIHHDSGCVSAGIRPNSPGQHRLGAGTACRAAAQSVTPVTRLASIEIATSPEWGDLKQRLVTGFVAGWSTTLTVAYRAPAWHPHCLRPCADRTVTTQSQGER